MNVLVDDVLRLVAIVCVIVYVIGVTACALLKSVGPVFGVPPWFVESTTWAEIFYGPACTVGSCFALFVLAHAVELRFRRD